MAHFRNWCETNSLISHTAGSPFSFSYYYASLWVIGVASCCVSCSQHLVVVVSENAGTALVWNSNGRCQRLGYGGSSLESVGFTAT